MNPNAGLLTIEGRAVGFENRKGLGVTEGRSPRQEKR